MLRRKTGRRHLVTLAVAAFLLAWPGTMAYAAGDGVEVTEISDHEQFARVVSDGWDEDYFAEVLVDTQKEEVTVDGEETTFEEIFDVEKPSEAPELESARAVEEYFEDQVCEAEIVEEGVVQVTNPYQSRQILLYAAKLDQNYGASEVFHLDIVGEYILQFDTEEATKAAYERMQPVYGDACVLNRVIRQDDMLLSGTAPYQGSYSWGAAYMGMAQLKTSPSLGMFKNEKVTVAVVDTGIDQSNFLFRGRAISGASRNLLENSANVYDDHVLGHGTHVAGIVADSTPDNVELMILKVFNAQGVTLPSVLQLAIQRAVDSGANVINMSLGTRDDIIATALQLDRFIDYAASKGVVICASAGNDLQDAGGTYPANNATVITVSGIREDGSFASEYSNFGSVIDFCAPGSNISSAARGGTLQSLSGTSMAAPHIAAAAAYIKMVMPEATVNQVRQVLRRYAVDLGPSGKDERYGYGAVQMKTFFDDCRSIDISRFSVSLPAGSTCTYTGKACKPAVQVEGVSASSYSVSYANNVEPGVGTVTVTGKGNYTGTVKVNFKIILAKPVLGSAANTSGGIQLKWKAAKGATGYRIYRRTGASGSWKKVKTIGSGKTVKWTDKTAANGRVYSYRIYTVRNKAVSAASSAKKICRLTSTKLSSLKNVSGRKMKVKWKKNSKAGGYQIQYATNKKFTSAKKVKVSAKSASQTITKLKKKKTYYVRVRSYKKTGGKTYYSAWSSAKKIAVRK
ncbi:MAG TPA: hypothetical protein DF613_16925 [Lachnospiraceae bacterium]|nr:hypothetical protein [Lachnospiraceae bacterium]